MTQNGASFKNMRLLGGNDLGGFGNCGEGMAIQLARDGRRVLWLGHESAPKNFTAVDVTDPRKPSVIVQTDLPHGDMRSNNLDLVGDLLVVPYQTSRVGMKPAGVEFFDVADPGKPRSIAFFDASGPHSRGVHHLWFVDGAYLHLASGAPDFKPRVPSRSVAGGSPGRATATRSRPRLAIRSSTPAFERTTRTSTRVDPTGPGSAISTAARSSSTSRTWPARVS